MLRLGCVCCAQLNIPNVAVDLHHIVVGNKRLGNWYTLPVCPGHHRGVWTVEQIELIPRNMRVSISSGSKVFSKLYGAERELWMKVQERLKLPAVWPSSKVLPRSRHVFTPPMGDVQALESQAPTEAVLPGSAADGVGDRGAAS